MRRGWLRRNRLNRTLRPFPGRRRVLCVVVSAPISLVKSRSGGLGYSNAKTARLILPGVPNPAFDRWVHRQIAFVGGFSAPCGFNLLSRT